MGRTIYRLASDLTCARGTHYSSGDSDSQRPPGHPDTLSPTHHQGGSVRLGHPCPAWPLPGHKGALPRSRLLLGLSPAHLLPAWPQASPAGPQMSENVGPPLAVRSLSGQFLPSQVPRGPRPSRALGLERDLLGTEPSPGLLCAGGLGALPPQRQRFLPAEQLEAPPRFGGVLSLAHKRHSAEKL